MNGKATPYSETYHLAPTAGLFYLASFKQYDKCKIVADFAYIISIVFGIIHKSAFPPLIPHLKVPRSATAGEYPADPLFCEVLCASVPKAHSNGAR